jgi:methionyl-tRNA formyltransferase
MSKVRIVFLGTPEFAVTSLKRLIDDSHFEIVAVISQPDRPAGRKQQLKASPVKELALASGLKVFTPQTVNTEEFRAEISALGAESGAVVAFGQILGQKFLDIFPKGCVNVHGSILPRWRGAAPIQRALMAGDTEGGVSLQIVVKKLDAGPVLGLRRVAIDDEIDAVKFHDDLKLLGADLLHVEYMDYLRGHLTASIQDESLVTIAPKIDKSEAKIDWSWSARAIMNRVRGLAMGPLTYAIRDGVPVKILRVRVAIENGATGAQGQVTEILPDSFLVACGSGALEILELQPESRSRQSARDYMRGYPVAVGTILS